MAKRKQKTNTRTQNISLTNQYLKTAAGHLNELVKVNTSIHSSITNLAKETKESNELQRKANDQDEAHQKDSTKERRKQTSWQKVTSYYTQQISKAFDNADNNQKASLLLGQQAFQFQRKSSVNLDRLSGKLTGFQEAFQVSYDKVSAGLDVNSYSLDRLGVATKVAGGSTTQLFSALKKNTVGLGFSNKQMNSLADTTLSLSQNFGVSVDQLTGSLDGLGESLLEFGVLGIAPQMEEAAMRLGAALGQGATGMGAKVLASFTKGSTMVQASILGVSEERERALRATGKEGTKAAMNLVLAAGKSSQQLIGSFIKGAKDPAFALEQATKIYGRETLQAYQYYNALQQKANEKGFATAEQYLESVRKQNKINEDFTKTWQNFKSIVLAPLMKAVSTAYNTISEFLTESPKFWDAAVLIGKSVTYLGVLLGGIGMGKGLFKFGKGLLRFGGGGSGSGGAGSAIGKSLFTVLKEGFGKLITYIKPMGSYLAKIAGWIGRAIGGLASVPGIIGATIAAVPAAALFDTYSEDAKKSSSIYISKKKEIDENLTNKLQNLTEKTEKVEFLKATYMNEKLMASENYENRQINEILIDSLNKMAQENGISNQYLAAIKDNGTDTKPYPTTTTARGVM